MRKEGGFASDSLESDVVEAAEEDVEREEEEAEGVSISRLPTYAREEEKDEEEGEEEEEGKEEEERDEEDETVVA